MFDRVFIVKLTNKNKDINYISSELHDQKTPDLLTLKKVEFSLFQIFNLINNHKQMIYRFHFL